MLFIHTYKCYNTINSHNNLFLNDEYEFIRFFGEYKIELRSEHNIETHTVFFNENGNIPTV